MRQIRILAASFVLIGLTVNIAFAGAKKEAGAAKKPVFVMVPKGVHPYYEPVYEGFKAAAAKYGVEVEMVTPPEFELTVQVKVIEDLIARRVDGITISALDDAGLVSVIADAQKAGIKVITFDAPAFSSSALTYIGTDNEAAGYEAGKKFAEVMGGTGQMAILQGGLAANLNLRTQGFRKAIAEFAPGIEILPLVDVEHDFAIAVNKTEALLQTYPNIKGIFAVSAEGAPAAAAVLKQQSKAGKIVLAGFDDLKDTLEGIQDGTISYCLVQKTFKMGWLSVERLLDATNGKSFPKIIDTGVLIVDKSNVDTYQEDSKEEFN